MPKLSGLGTKQSKSGGTGLRAAIVCVAVSAAALTMYVREGTAGPVHTARSVVTAAATPARVVGAVVAAPFAAVGDVVANTTADDETLTRLRDENAKLTSQVAELTEKSKDAQRLQGLLKLRDNYNLKSTAARIIGRTSDAWSDEVTIDRGSKDGVAAGMAVTDDGGVIGQTVEVSASTSTVRLITDEDSGVSAMVQASRAQGMLKGQPDGSLRMDYVPAGSDVKAGDLVVTSGIGGVFPKGLPLGRVSTVEKTANAIYYTILVTPVSSTESNEEVLVITSLTDEQVASDQEVAQANSDPQGSSGAASGASGSAQDAAAQGGQGASGSSAQASGSSSSSSGSASSSDAAGSKRAGGQ